MRVRRFLFIFAVLVVSGYFLAPTFNVDRVTRIAGEVERPLRLAVGSQGMVWVSDPGRNRVALFDSQGRLIRHLDTGGIPVGVAVDGQGRVFVGSGTKVETYDSGGQFLFALGSGEGEFALPNDMAVGAEGRVYVVDSWDHRVKVYDSEGRFLFSFGSEGDGDGEFRFPAGIAVDDGRGEVVVSDQINARIEVFDTEGTWLRSFGQYTYSSDGGQSWVYEGTFTCPQGVAVDFRGWVYVVDAYQSGVQIVDGQGTHLGFIGSYGVGEGQFCLPMDVALRGSGCDQSLYVTSMEGGSVEVFALALGMKGDVNNDGQVNVLDVIRAVNIILGVEPPPSEYELWAADCNGDGAINVLDVVEMVNIILGVRSPRVCGFGESLEQKGFKGGNDGKR